jgi:thioesterase domain-containing protein
MGPYQFVGLCRGAHIAYEMARRLEQEGARCIPGYPRHVGGREHIQLFWFLEQYWNRLIWLARVGPREQFSFINKKTREVLTNLVAHISTFVGARSLKRKHNPIHDLYFPGPDFVPRTYEGRIAVFRVANSLVNGFATHSSGGASSREAVWMYAFIPGSHSSVLREPHVQGLAAELKKYLLQYSKSPSEESLQAEPAV